MKAAVIGSPISHSLSPVLHRAAYASLGLDHSYEAINVDVPGFANFMKSIDDTWLGLSLTMPLKEIASSVASTVSETAILTQSINTLTFGESIRADNTDVYGISVAIKECGATSTASAYILGSGATARSAIMASSELGITALTVVARNPDSIKVCSVLASTLGITLQVLEAPGAELNDVDVVINTTPQGVADQWVPTIAKPQGVLLDAVYKPHPTQLVATWLSHGGVACPGYNMLLHQAVRQVELMTGFAGPLDDMRAALKGALRQQGTIN